MSDSIEKIISLAKRRGFVYPGSEIYGGLANSWDYGPLGVELKNNIKQEWWKRFVQKRGDMVGIDAALIMNPKVWEASGHLKNFTDPLVECKNCHERYRADQPPVSENKSCPKCGKKEFTEGRQFNLMLKTFLGAIDPVNSLWQAYQSGCNTNDIIKVLQEFHTSAVYFRPETAQGMFVDFKQVLETSRKKPPFGVAQIGKAFRNEITPGNFIFRTREFEQMEIEYFIPEPKSDEEWNKYFEEWLEEMRAWIKHLGINYDNIYELEVAPEDRAHYSKRTIDFEYKFPFGQKELYGLAYRGNFDLTNHSNASGEVLKYQDPTTNEKYIPHVIEPTWGVDRSVLAAMCEAYQEEDVIEATATSIPESDMEIHKTEATTRIVMKFPKWLAPIKVAVLPLMKKTELAEPAKKLADELREEFSVDYDETQSIGKRYRRQDEIGTPYCITFDFDSLTDNSVTVRDRDSMKQERILIKDLKKFISKGLKS